MQRWHFYVMGLISLLYGVLAMAEYILISYGLRLGWLVAYPQNQIEWLASLPGWIHGVWGAHVTLALVGSLCLLAHVRSAVWMLFFAFLSLIVLYVWMLALAEPSLMTLIGGNGMSMLVIVLIPALSFLIYLYARQEKQLGEVL